MAMIMGLCGVGRIRDAPNLFYRMRQNGCDPDAITLGDVVDGFCRVGDFDGVYEAMHMLEKDGVVLGKQGYTSCFRWLLEARRIDEAISWYWRMCSEGVKPDEQLCAVMIKGLGCVRQASFVMLLYCCPGWMSVGISSCYSFFSAFWSV
ncbi:hypothetical protein MLD38_031023 [Melastoma candidum]|uniref:Uncharacterized protein n=1 Tax=Melastoma candidum TaxID=119954 RepID=A0ACB9MNG3_9MYRT|nr:hypothetical protein MLD38_031023 [Melastoma candidum]